MCMNGRKSYHFTFGIRKIKEHVLVVSACLDALIGPSSINPQGFLSDPLGISRAANCERCPSPSPFYHSTPDTMQDARFMTRSIAFEDPDEVSPYLTKVSFST